MDNEGGKNTGQDQFGWVSCLKDGNNVDLVLQVEFYVCLSYKMMETLLQGGVQ